MQRLVSRLARISLNPNDVATACRLAAVAFMDTKHWSKRDLAAWLVESYQFATLRGHGGGVAPKHHGTVSREKLVDLMERVRDEVRDMLDHVLTGDPSFAEELVRAGVVAPLKLPNGKVLFVAMNHKGLRLADRVLSLFAADYLMRPQDYRARLSVCDHCHAVSFTGECRHPHSGIFLSKEGREVPEPDVTCTVVIDEALEEGAGLQQILAEVQELEEGEMEIEPDDIIAFESLAS